MNHYKGAIPILLLLISLGVGYFFVYPQWNLRAETISEYDVLKQKNDELTKQEKEVSTFVNKYRQSQNDIEKANKILPIKKSEIPTVLADLERFLLSSAMVATNVMLVEDSDKAAIENTIKYYDININTSGTYPALRNFLMNAENHLRLFDVHSIDVRAGDNSTETSAILEIKLVIRVYYQK
jgi:Tfp pilus assembly protein PilO